MSKSMNTSSVSPGLSDVSNLYDTNSSYSIDLVWSIESFKARFVQYARVQLACARTYSLHIFFAQRLAVQMSAR